MITEIIAIQIAEEYVSELGRKCNEEFSLLMEEITDVGFGWVFFYQSKMYIETGDIIYFLVGNAPIVISKKEGVIYETGTAHPVEFYLEEIRSRIIANEK